MVRAFERLVAFPRAASEEVRRDVEARLLVRPHRILALLLSINVVLALADLATLWLSFHGGSEQLRRVFDVDREQSLPTWFSAIQLFLAHLLLLLIAWIELGREARLGRYWLALAAILLVLSIDEVAGIHETGSLALTHAGIGGDWVILGAIITAIVGAWFIPFLLRLPRSTALLFCLSGVVLFSGALGVEVIDLQRVDSGPSLTGGLVAATEEFLERLGAALFLFAVLLHLRDHMGLRGVVVVHRPREA